MPKLLPHALGLAYRTGFVNHVIIAWLPGTIVNEKADELGNLGSDNVFIRPISVFKSNLSRKDACKTP